MTATKFLKSLHVSWFSIILLSLVVLGFGLRMHQYWEFPVVGETKDELAWTMLGASLLQTGEPQSWSYFSAYEDVRSVVYGDFSLQIVRPALDHPPLFSFLPGLATTLSGNAWDMIPSSKVIRAPMVLLGMVNVLLLSYWMYAVWGKSVRTVVAIGLMSTIPSFVFLSRLVVSENLLVTVFLGSLIFLHHYKHLWAQWALWLCLFALPLIKISGLPLAAGIIVGSLQMVKIRETKKLIIATFLGIGTLLAYMALFNFELFWQVQFGQAGRDVGFMTAYLSQFSLPTLVEKVSTDAWVLLGYVSVVVSFWLIPERKTNDYLWWKLLLTVFVSQFAFLLLSSGEHTVHGWYRIVFIPIFVYFLAILAERLWKQVNWLVLSGVLLLINFIPRGVLRGVVDTVRFWELQPFASRVWIALSGFPIVADVSQHFFGNQSFWKKAWQMLLVIIFVIVLASHAVTIYTMTKEIYWEDELYLESGIRS